jgi:single-strand DNA-binding protein
MQNINRVVLTGNLTRDPELRTTPGGTPICQMRVACNQRSKRNGEWVERPNFFDIKVFNAQGENAARYLAKGRSVAVDGRLQWSEWIDDHRRTHQRIEIIADTIQFLGVAPQGSSASPTDHASDVTPVSL